MPEKGTLPDHVEKQIALAIQMDIVGGSHDNTRKSYKKMVQLAMTPTVQIRTSSLTVLPENHFVLHEELTRYYVATGRDISKDFYNACHVMAKNWGDNTLIEQVPEKLMKMKYASKNSLNKE